jgi:hypothetical protein
VPDPTNLHEKRLGAAVTTTASAPADPTSPVDTPGHHGFFMMGTGTLFLSHMPMFTMENHMYQVILRASFAPEAMAAYVAAKKTSPTTVFNLINVEDDAFTLPDVQNGTKTSFTATIYNGYSSDGNAGPVLLDNVPTTIDRIVHFRHFDASFSHPTVLTYILFGAGDEAFISHYISVDPDFQHIVELASPPDWLPASQIQAGVNVNFPDIPSAPVPCSSPLTESTYKVQFQGWPGVRFPVALSENATYWFSTGNLLNKTDPCAST